MATLANCRSLQLHSVIHDFRNIHTALVSIHAHGRGGTLTICTPFWQQLWRKRNRYRRLAAHARKLLDTMDIRYSLASGAHIKHSASSFAATLMSGVCPADVDEPPVSGTRLICVQLPVAGIHKYCDPLPV